MELQQTEAASRLASEQVGKAEGNFPWIAFAEAGLMAVSAHRGKYEGIFRSGRQSRRQLSRDRAFAEAGLMAVSAHRGKFEGIFRTGRQVQKHFTGQSLLHGGKFGGNLGL